jgi:hypothetical protein
VRPGASHEDTVIHQVNLGYCIAPQTVPKDRVVPQDVCKIVVPALSDRVTVPVNIVVHKTSHESGRSCTTLYNS